MGSTNLSQPYKKDPKDSWCRNTSNMIHTGDNNIYGNRFWPDTTMILKDSLLKSPAHSQANEGLNTFPSFTTLQQTRYLQAASAQAAAMTHNMKLSGKEIYVPDLSVVEKTQGSHGLRQVFSGLNDGYSGEYGDMFEEKQDTIAKEEILDKLSKLRVNYHKHDEIQKNSQVSYLHQAKDNEINYNYQKNNLFNYYTLMQNMRHETLNSKDCDRIYSMDQKKNSMKSLIHPYMGYTNNLRNFFKESSLNQNGSYKYNGISKKQMYSYYSVKDNDFPKNTVNMQSTVPTKHPLKDTTPLVTYSESETVQKDYSQGGETQPTGYSEDMFYYPQQYYDDTLHVLQQTYVRPISSTLNFSTQIRRENDRYQSLRSSLLEEFRNNKNKKYELKDIFGHIVEFSGDQHGSRFIQQALEEANSEDKEVVFQEIYPNSLQLMTDVFGNYIIQKFIEHGSQTQKTLLLEQMKGHILNLSLQTYGCRVVQKALEYIEIDQQINLVKELDGNVLRCIKNQNGNHVIQKIIEKVPMKHMQFIINTFQGQIYTLATHPYGCRVVQRMLGYCSQARDLLNELHLYSRSLIRDQYGNYCIQHIIEKGEPEDRSKVISVVKENILKFSKHKFASNVVEKCITYGTDEEKRLLIDKIMENDEDGFPRLLPMMKDQYANYVIKKALDVASGDQLNKLIAEIKPHLQFLKKNVHGKALSLNIERLITLSNNQSNQNNETLVTKT
ncbi:hypothetical protein PNEG_01310 [Pneumocystis murina B123]|uniref:Pumilio homology domain family member 3 n=1 Tax=Pneumocystis murina (strain B123) TaxID=1069680 RepID=M7NTJ6_PNEMU|nr:hypothetical protein PNEG_01310 [Pneumocystis murina B123]EMR10607.1 hypothetical protein PNEG_01310 [Pneumocystis murina B123]